MTIFAQNAVFNLFEIVPFLLFWPVCEEEAWNILILYKLYYKFDIYKRILIKIRINKINKCSGIKCVLIKIYAASRSDKIGALEYFSQLFFTEMNDAAVFK